MIKNKKNFILCLSLILNLVLGGSLIYKSIEMEKFRQEMALNTFLSNNNENKEILKNVLDRLSNDGEVKILNSDSEDVTSVYRETFLELRKEGRFEKIQEIILSENLSISFY